MFKKISENIIEITVFLTPGAKKEAVHNVIVDENGVEMLKVSVFAHAESNKANIALIKLFSKYFKIPKSNIQIKSGLKSRKKILLLTNVNQIILSNTL